MDHSLLKQLSLDCFDIIITFYVCQLYLMNSLLGLRLFSNSIKIFIYLCTLIVTGNGSVKPVSLLTTPFKWLLSSKTERPKSVRNRCVIELFSCVMCCIDQFIV